MSDPIMRLFAVNWVAQLEAKRLVLGLREMLVRFDENLAAHTLMQDCVPHILEEDPDIDRARAEQALKVDHIVGESYSEYYATNHHEKPFEEQYQCEAEVAHEHLYRVGYLRRWLEDLDDARWPAITLLDVACNDGWMAKNLQGLVNYTGLDLNPHCLKRAGDRMPESLFLRGFAEDAEKLTRKVAPDHGYDVVVAYELVEHVRDPDKVLAAMVACCRPGGSLFVSTPLGACTGGDLPRWWVVEPAGHVRAYTPKTFHALLARHGEVAEIVASQAEEGALLVARVEVPGP